jgi:hypothetical protein
LEDQILELIHAADDYESLVPVVQTVDEAAFSEGHRKRGKRSRR